MSSNGFQIDLNRLDDPRYIFQPDVFNHLFELNYKQETFVYGCDGSDSEHYLADKNIYYEIFLDCMKELYHDNDLKAGVIDILFGYPLPKYYYFTYCVVCLESHSIVKLLPCMHVCLCDSCDDDLVENEIRTCPVCRTTITESTRSSAIEMYYSSKKNNNSSDN